MCSSQELPEGYIYTMISGRVIQPPFANKFQELLGVSHGNRPDDLGFFWRCDMNLQRLSENLTKTGKSSIWIYIHVRSLGREQLCSGAVFLDRALVVPTFSSEDATQPRRGRCFSTTGERKKGGGREADSPNDHFPARLSKVRCPVVSFRAVLKEIAAGHRGRSNIEDLLGDSTTITRNSKNDVGATVRTDKQTIQNTLNAVKMYFTIHHLKGLEVALPFLSQELTRSAGERSGSRVSEKDLDINISPTTLLSETQSRIQQMIKAMEKDTWDQQANAGHDIIFCNRAEFDRYKDARLKILARSLRMTELHPYHVMKSAMEGIESTSPSGGGDDGGEMEGFVVGDIEKLERHWMALGEVEAAEARSPLMMTRTKPHEYLIALAIEPYFNLFVSSLFHSNAVYLPGVWACGCSMLTYALRAVLLTSSRILKTEKGKVKHEVDLRFFRRLSHIKKMIGKDQIKIWWSTRKNKGSTTRARSKDRGGGGDEIRTTTTTLTVWKRKPALILCRLVEACASALREEKQIAMEMTKTITGKEPCSDLKSSLHSHHSHYGSLFLESLSRLKEDEEEGDDDGGDGGRNSKEDGNQDGDEQKAQESKNQNTRRRSSRRAAVKEHTPYQVRGVGTDLHWNERGGCSFAIQGQPR
eukprot:jgi/Bigna1/80388/fgenesh1_pg.70_\